jgi:energy-coupling factor transporter ATP-binding protein EcfA2
VKLVIENIRSFADHHEFKIRPLTVLVGENSSGKSTFLAALSAVSDAVSFPGVAALNKPPYDLGTFDTIATFKGGRGGRAKAFSLGYLAETKIKGKEREQLGVIATFCSEDGEARIRNLALTAGAVEVKMAWEKEKIAIRIHGLEGADTINSSVPFDPQQLSGMTLTALTSLISTVLINPRREQRESRISYDLYMQIQEKASQWREAAPRATSIAPIRSEPKRTYDRMSDEYYPSGDHVPYVLARLLLQDDAGKGRKLHEALVSFGNDSGLFRNINVKRLGNKAGDPFQVQVTVGGPSVNLSDVGYGVSQSLPVIVESILRATNARILLQQPEVHLHPRAQAALGSFFAKLVVHEHRHFVIETHSDYLIDRIRQEVATGGLDAEDVSILFFDRPHIETTVTELTLDEHGNIENAPENYRTFFLEEELRLLARAGSE